ncbi:MAG: DUF1353 domain-containing protein [Kiritimatiellae bacterium]|nr:DUF1353 domain-containing protein [Kiritimatiellia bacterium]
MRTEWADCCAPNVRLPDTTLGETECVLLSDWTVSVRGHTFTIAAGTTTDGASIPRFLWRLCGHPLEAPRVYAALLHDWLYTGDESDKDGAQPSDLSRKEADRCYWALLRHFGVPAWRAKIEYWALRMFGGSHYIE